jgi:hypothetical protein
VDEYAARQSTSGQGEDWRHLGDIGDRFGVDPTAEQMPDEREDADPQQSSPGRPPGQMTECHDVGT